MSPVVVEYMLIVKAADTFCSSAEAFTALLNVDAAIRIQGGKVKFNGDAICDYGITTGEIAAKQQRYFHVRFSAEDCAMQSQLDRFSDFLRTARIVMARLCPQPEVLWDDISSQYAMRAYAEIHRLENLMRKLITNFMCVTVGADWLDENSPAEVKDVVKKGKRKVTANPLHQTDFIHLADFLLRPYMTISLDELHQKLREATSLEELKGIQSLLPQSNWTRYFSSLVECEDVYLKTRWASLYELRCEVAHNAIISKRDFEEVIRLVADLEKKLNDAVKKLPQVVVPHAELERLIEVPQRAECADEESQMDITIDDILKLRMCKGSPLWFLSPLRRVGPVGLVPPP